MTEKENHLKELRSRAMRLPLSPGVYIMHDKSDKIIYIGKAKALKNRVSQYFGSQKNHDNKVRKMVSNVEYFEYILTDSEFEALVLECSLIKQHTPKYNILLKDDKGYHYIKITKGPWPKISEAKQILDDGATYIGPYISSWATKQSIDEALKIFKLPSCSRNFPQDIGKRRPCLNYYIKQCCAPCSGKIRQKEYDEYVEQAIEFLRGGSAKCVRELTEKMNDAAESLEFEKAAKIRDCLSAIKRMGDRQKVVAVRYPVQDIIALAQGDMISCFEVFRFMDGRLSDRETFLMGETGNSKAARTEFIERYYSMRERIPPRICIDGSAEDLGLLKEWLSKKAGKKIVVSFPQKGEQAKLVEMCRNNAAEQVAQATGRTVREASALDELARLLGMDKPPVYIESYDISNLNGSENVAGMVVYKNGRPLKSAYRKFKIKSFSGQDDYASMQEVVERRFKEYFIAKGKNITDGFGRLPDLILLDGGKGQVGAVLPILKSLELSVPLFGMVKDDKHRTRGLIYGNEEMAISRDSNTIKLITRIQDEVHRFAVTYHRSLRSKRVLHSVLEDIPNVGVKRRKELLKKFLSVENIKKASIEELISTPSIDMRTAESIVSYFRGYKS